MKIISHRGYWKKAEEKNTNVAFERSFSLNFGTETDFRDYGGNIVISHDIANSNCLPAEDFFKLFKQNNHSLPLAINVKADGLQVKIKALLAKYEIENYFVFDMSVPDTILYKNNNIRFFSRQSEYEPQPVFYKDCKGIWLDAFIDTWYNADLILQHLDKKKQVAIVSPDLHKRDYYLLWNYLKDNDLHNFDEIILCTDRPEDARGFFNEI